MTMSDSIEALKADLNNPQDEGATSAVA